MPDDVPIRQIDALLESFTHAVSLTDLQSVEEHFVAEGRVTIGLRISACSKDVRTFVGALARRSCRLSALRLQEQVSNTQIFGNTSQRMSMCTLSGDGRNSSFRIQGVLFTQIVRSGPHWKIASLSWARQRPGVALTMKWSDERTGERRHAPRAQQHA